MMKKDIILPNVRDILVGNIAGLRPTPTICSIKFAKKRSINYTDTKRVQVANAQALLASL